MTQSNNNSIQAILQEALKKDEDFMKEIVKNTTTTDGRRKRSTGRRIISPER